MEESLELQGHHRLGNGAGVKVLFGDSLGIPDLNHSSQAPIPGWISGAETDVHGTAWGGALSSLPRVVDTCKAPLEDPSHLTVMLWSWFFPLHLWQKLLEST